MQKLNVPLDPENGYSIVKGDNPTYLGSLQAKILFKQKEIGVFLKKFLTPLDNGNHSS